MATVIRPELSKKHKYWIPKLRHYELKYFCLQYPVWKKALEEINDSNMSLSNIEHVPSNNSPSDPTGNLAVLNAYYSERIELIERTALETEPGLYKYILRAVTEGLSFPYLKSRLEIPCGKDMYYDRYRKFFWLLSQAKK